MSQEKEAGFFQVLSAAFNAKVQGFPISLNWLALGAVGILGVFDVSFLYAGLSAELVYLTLLVTNPSFQRFTERQRQLSATSAAPKQTVDKLIGFLDFDARDRFYALRDRCKFIVDFYSNQLGVEHQLYQFHEQSLNRFVWIFLQLLVTQESLHDISGESKLTGAYRAKLEDELAQLEYKLTGNLPDTLRQSFTGQRDLLAQRLKGLSEAEEKLQYVESELRRIEHQVELLREQAVMSKDAASMTAGIDTVSESLGETASWIREQQSLFGNTQSLSAQNEPYLLTYKPQTYDMQ